MLTFVVIKSFEQLVLAHLKSITGFLLDLQQFGYRTNRSVDDTINVGLYNILQHLGCPRTYARILFLDFSSLFKYHYFRNPFFQALSVQCLTCHMSLDHHLPNRQGTCKTGGCHFPYEDEQHWGTWPLPTEILLLFTNNCM